MIDFNTIGEDILHVLTIHNIPVALFNVTVTMSPEEFDQVLGDYPDLIEGQTVIVNVTMNNIQGSIQIRKRYTFPPELVIHPGS
jgi:hypothetical protein